MKIKRDEAHPGKGSFWTFTPGYESCLNGGHFKPIRSRSGRAALAAAAAMAAAKSSTGSPSANDLAADANSDSEARLPGQEEKSAKKGEKKTVRAIKSAKSLKRSHSVPPKDHSAPLPQGASDADAAAAAAAVTAGEAAFAMSMACVSDAMFPGPLMHCETAPAGLMTGRNATKKMRVSSSQSHMNIASMSAVTPGGASMMSYPQTPSFVPSPAPYMASPALMSATPMSVVSTAAHTPLNQPAQFQFHMPSPCSMPLPISAMDMASVPANNAGGPYGIGSAFMGPHTAHLGEAAHAGIDGTPMFGDAVSTSDPLYATRRSNMHPRISWHGSESMNQAFAGLQHPGQQCHPNSLGVTMGPESMDIGLTMLGDGHGGMCMAGDGAVNTTPVDWAMFAGMSAPHPIQTDMSMNTPQLHHMSSISTIDASSSGPQSQQRPAGTSGIDAAATTSAGSASGPGIMALYDEVLRDSSSLMNVFGQDLSGWQCPTKTNTIDPAALCAVDPDTSSL
ncbi:hypothetical protein IWW50_005324 [Coemansia erecta]|nr:hypothetical protein IWW50_005324 [Coemansia erecta]